MTMKTVSFLRHAKSSWSDAFQPDIERPLAERGWHDAPRMGAWIAENTSLDLAILSPARRAQETFFASKLEIPLKTDERLYPTQSGNVLRLLNGLDESCRHILIVGHNPGISNSVRNFLTSFPDNPKLEDMPTCSCAILEFPNQNWHELNFSCASLKAFMRPKAL